MSYSGSTPGELSYQPLFPWQPLLCLRKKTNICSGSGHCLPGRAVGIGVFPGNTTCDFFEITAVPGQPPWAATVKPNICSTYSPGDQAAVARDAAQLNPNK